MPRGRKKGTTISKPLTKIKHEVVEPSYVKKTIKDYVVDAKQRAGKREMLNHLNRKKQAASQAIKAMCFMCCGYYQDGANDCELHDCPLYPWMPFGSGKTWFEKSKRGGRKKLVEE